MARKHFISAFLLILLAAGCQRPEIPVAGGDGTEPIGFSASTLQLSTKAASFKDEFERFDDFDVFARRNISGVGSDFMNGTAVELNKVTPDSTWTYSPLQFWIWSRTFDYYDFIGVCPVNKGTRVPGLDNLEVRAPYSVYESPKNFDLMMACRRREGNEADPNAVVPMRFDHMLSAVRVVITNDSENANLTLNYFEFQHLILEGAAYASIDAMGQPEYRWSDLMRNSDVTDIRKVNVEQTLKSKSTAASDAERKYTGNYDFLIPCDLTQTSNGLTDSDPSYRDYVPTLHIRHSGSVDEYIKLMEVPRKDKTLITEWKRGIKYTYYISIRLDGGVIVHIITTEWDEVDAETPGIMIEFPS